MESLLNSMKDYNSMIGNKFQLENTTFCISDLVTEIADLFKY